jgi:D-alanine-D-alanine ligase
MKQTVALLFGGKGEEHGVSCRSAAAVFERLRKSKYRVIPIGIDRGGDFFFYRGDMAAVNEATLSQRRDLLSETFPMRLGARSGFFSEGEVLPVDVAIPVLHGRGGEDGEVQGLLSAAGIPFVGCGPVASAVCFDKEYTKCMAASVGVPTVRGVTLFPSETLAEAEARVYAQFSEREALFIKPARQGSSFGASVAMDRASFGKSRDLAIAYGKALAEEYIGEKRELEVAFLQREGKNLFAGPGEILSGAPFYSYKEKYEKDGARLCLRAEISGRVRRELLSYCEALVSALDLCGLARLDFFLTPEGRLYFNEVNTLPGFTETSLYPRLWEAEGLSFSSLPDILIGEALARASG